MKRNDNDLPRSATTGWINMTGLACAIAALIWLALHRDVNAISAAILMMVSYALPIAALELWVRKAHLRPSSGLRGVAAPRYDINRIATKTIGLCAILGAVAATHAAFRFYPVDSLKPILAAMAILAPALLVVSVAYIAWVDARMIAPRDGYWQIGAWLTGRSRKAEVPGMRTFALGWVIKGFFLPIMFFYLTANLRDVGALHIWFQGDLVTITRRLMLLSIVLELVVVCVGYTLTLRLFDAHIRSTNPLLWGWLVTLACYEPFNHVLSGRILVREIGAPWYETILSYPLLSLPWLALLLLSFGIWVWATCSFGLRWSNLTNRGVVTCGPYRYTKHPDYVSKSIFFWLTAVPFMTDAPASARVAATLSLIVTNIIYFARARAEEVHMSEDPDYVTYALAMNERSVFSPLARLFPVLAYRSPAPTARTQHSLTVEATRNPAAKT